jgi:hypothetical protein
MIERNWNRVWRRIHAHTERVMIECADHGYGCDHDRAVKSASRLMDLVEEVVKHEAMVAHSKGYAEGRKGAA